MLDRILQAYKSLTLLRCQRNCDDEVSDRNETSFRMLRLSRYISMIRESRRWFRSHSATLDKHPAGGSTGAARLSLGLNNPAEIDLMRAISLVWGFQTTVPGYAEGS